MNTPIETAGIDAIFWLIMIALAFALMIEFRWLIAEAWDALVEAWRHAGRNSRSKTRRHWD